MALAAGTRLGPYAIVAPLGAGGMGEVYQARDTRLDRTVAIKVLPAHVSADPARRARFEREARAVAKLNHPHIVTIHEGIVQTLNTPYTSNTAAGQLSISASGALVYAPGGILPDIDSRLV